MTSVKWIKLTISMFDDEKIKLIQSMPEGDALLVVWVRLLVLAGKVNDGGFIYLSEGIPYTDEMLSTIFQKPLSTVRLALSVFAQFGMTEMTARGIFLPSWEEHQNVEGLEKIREQTKKRVAAHREKGRPYVTLPVTPSNAPVTLPVTLRNATDLDIDLDIDLEHPPIVPPEVDDGHYQNRATKPPCERLLGEMPAEIDSTQPIGQATNRYREQSFEKFWNAYPKKTGKQSTQVVWNQLSPTPELLNRVIGSLTKEKASRQWQAEGGRYIPKPENWLSQRPWVEEQIVTQDMIDAKYLVEPDFLALYGKGGVARGKNSVHPRDAPGT